MSRLNANNLFFLNQHPELPLFGPALKELLTSVFEKGLPFRFKAKGSSMSPFIRDGDVLTLSPLDKGRPKIGEVILFVHPVGQHLVVHRVVGKSGNSYRVKGDNSLGMDNPLPQDSILGRLNRLERNGKRVILGLGPERILIAFLTRRNLLRSLTPLWQSVRSRLKKPLT